MNNILRIDKLHKKYHTKEGMIEAIGSISLDVNEGEYIAIVGPSGCGKSTLLNIIGGIDTKSSGDIIMNNNLRIGYMLQNDCLFPWLNILDNCLLGLKVRNEINKDNVDYVISLLNTYGLKDFMYKYPNNLSGGMRQRVV